MPKIFSNRFSGNLIVNLSASVGDMDKDFCRKKSGWRCRDEREVCVGKILQN